MKMKIGHRQFDITNKDILVFNEVIYYLQTQSYFKDWCNVRPTMSKTQFKKLLKENALQLIGRKFWFKDKQGKDHYLTYYNFCIENIKTEKKESSKNENANRTQNI